MKPILSIIAVAFSASIFAGDLLPNEADLPKTLAQIQNGVDASIKVKVNSYVDQKKQNYSTDVTCPGENTVVGNLNFQGSAYTGDFDGGNDNDFGGFILRGGFRMGNGYRVCPGFSMRWLQVVSVTDEVRNGTAVAARRFVDGTPYYPNFTLAGYEPLLFDAPGRGLGGTQWSSITWRAESALVCWDGARKIKYMGSFTWGFNIRTAGGATTVTGAYPAGWSSNFSQASRDQFAAEYAGWTLEQGCCVCPVPEPGTLAACGIGLAAIARRRRRGLKAA